MLDVRRIDRLRNEGMRATTKVMDIVDIVKSMKRKKKVEMGKPCS